MAGKDGVSQAEAGTRLAQVSAMPQGAHEAHAYPNLAACLLPHQPGALSLCVPLSFCVGWCPLMCHLILPQITTEPPFNRRGLGYGSPLPPQANGILSLARVAARQLTPSCG